MLRFLTAGESHGRGLLVIVEGLPAGLPLTAAWIDADLERRQQGYGRGGRMKIEKDRARIVSGVRHGETLGSPVGLLIDNKDWPRWEKVMAAEPVETVTSACHYRIDVLNLLKRVAVERSIRDGGRISVSAVVNGLVLKHRAELEAELK